MGTPGYRRYFFEWMILMTGMLLLGEGIGPLVWGEGARVPVVVGLAVVGVAVLPVYVLVARGLIVDPARFMRLWGLSLLGKFAWLVMASAIVLLGGFAPRDPFLLVMAVAFPVLTFHQVIRLVLLADREGGGIERRERATAPQRDGSGVSRASSTPG